MCWFSSTAQKGSETPCTRNLAKKKKLGREIAIQKRQISLEEGLTISVALAHV